MNICRLCNGNDIAVIHRGTRDRADIDVLRCNQCGLVFLSRIVTDDNFYTNSQMHEGTNFEKWRENTFRDDQRRFLKYRDQIQDKTILDFGCGNGNFLRQIQKYGNAKRTIGIELDQEAVNYLRKDGLECYENIDELPDIKFDFVFLFHVIEHLPEPEKLLHALSKHIAVQGRIIIETPNADDALLSIYQCEKFANFTYWSPHIYLYNEETLTQILVKAGLKVIDQRQEQRYPLANHLRWLARGLPGGGYLEFQELNEPKVNEEYAKILEKNKACDTLLFTAVRERLI
ncbi:MAG: class I SAM-dependent methyltransferase [Lachnospiraceae bacterium]|nr:class I SAM-dependent methyltransferase [Lachnospiraceae bacterium]